MLAALGVFVFQIKTAPFQQLQRTTAHRWAGAARVGGRAAYQYAGKGDDSIVLSGSLYPEITGGRLSLDALRAMADLGKAWPLIDGEGTIYGLWFIESISETRSQLMKHGEANKIDFSINLKRADDSRADQIGALTRIGLGLAK